MVIIQNFFSKTVVKENGIKLTRLGVFFFSLYVYSVNCQKYEHQGVKICHN